MVGDAALEAFDRLTHRKVFALGGLPSPGVYRFELGQVALTPVGVVNGDLWTVRGHLYVRINGSTVGPLVMPSPVAADDFTVLANPVPAQRRLS
jgi:hypothetical protein